MGRCLSRSTKSCRAEAGRETHAGWPGGRVQEDPHTAQLPLVAECRIGKRIKLLYRVPRGLNARAL